LRTELQTTETDEGNMRKKGRTSYHTGMLRIIDHDKEGKLKMYIKKEGLVKEELMGAD
jgi:hypothetical protein